MPGQTPKLGLPYALPEDKRINWPATSQQLAEKLEAAPRMASGWGRTSGPAGAQVTFPVGLFTQAPRVVVTLASNAGSEATGSWILQTGNKSATGCTVFCSIPGVAFQDAFFDWIAVGI